MILLGALVVFVVFGLLYAAAKPPTRGKGGRPLKGHANAPFEKPGNEGDLL